MRSPRARARQALILLAVVLQCGLLLFIGISLLSLSTMDARLLALRADGASALELAQAGVTRAGWVLSRPQGLAGWTQDGTAFPMTPGAYAVTIRPVPADPTLFEVTSTGAIPTLVSPRVKRTVVAHLRREPALAFAAFAGTGGVVVTGHATVKGSLYSGAAVTLGSAMASLEAGGDIRAVGQVDSGVRAEGRIRDGSQARSLPLVDTALLQAQARADGTHFATREDFLTALAAHGKHLRGTWFVADPSPLQLPSGIDIRGTLVLSGAASFDGGITHHGDAAHAALISLGSDPVRVNGFKTRGNGASVVVAAGPLALSGSVDLDGGVYASTLTLGDEVHLEWNTDLAQALPEGLSQAAGEGVSVVDWTER